MKIFGLLFTLLTAASAFSALTTPDQRKILMKPKSRHLASANALSSPLSNEVIMTDGMKKSFLKNLRGGATGANAALLNEALGTALLTTVAAVLSTSNLNGATQALTIGATLMALVYNGAKISGANYNPAVSAGLTLLGKMTPKQGAAYIASQVLGATIGAVGAKALVGGTLPDPSFVLTRATGTPDLIFSFALVLTVLQTAVARSQFRNSFFGLAIGSVVAVGAALGAGMNPAVAAGLAAAGGVTKGLAARAAVPLVGALLAALVFRSTDSDEAVTPNKGYFPAVPGNFVRNYGSYVGEAVGTFLLSSAVCLALSTGALSAPLAAGLTLTYLAFGGGYVSGSHVNPAVTLGTFLRNRSFGKKKLVGYIVAQTAGALAAVTAINKALGSSAGFPSPQAGFSVNQAFGAEALFTGLLVHTVLNAGAAGYQLSGLAVSLSLMVGLFAAGGISGGGLNPAIATALYLKNGGAKQLSQLALYVTAPLVGAVAAVAATKATSN